MPTISRRGFLTLGAVAVVGSAVATSTYLVRNDQSQQIVVEHIPIPIKNLNPALEGFKIAVIADFHLYPFTKVELVAQAVSIANSLNPDVTVLLGDYVWHELDAIFDLTPVLAQLKARYGVFSIRGNHDLWKNVEVITAAFAKEGMDIMVNQGVTITVDNAPLYLAALDDGWSGNPDLNAALAAAPPEAPVILLYHEPDLADDIAQDGRVALQLSGHSHGGQIRFKQFGAPILPYLGRKYDMGLFKVGNMWLYTNRGLGVTNEPFRINCAPEVTEITLVNG